MCQPTIPYFVGMHVPADNAGTICSGNRHYSAHTDTLVILLVVKNDSRGTMNSGQPPLYRDRGCTGSAVIWTESIRLTPDNELCNKGHSYRKAFFFFQIFDICFAQRFDSQYFPDFFFPKCVKFNELDFFPRGEFHE